MRRPTSALITTLAVVVAATAQPAAGSPSPTVAAAGAAPSRSAPAVSVATYSLGDQAFVDPTVPDLDTGEPVPQELTAVVHYPTDVGSGDHPLVMIVHGSWWSCVNETRGKPAGGWPCQPGTVPLESYRGYDYLGQTLAARGYVVVSISVNAINAHVLGDPDYYGRAHQLNQHLSMWQQLADTGSGPLVGAFRDASTGAVVDPAFTGHVDPRRVGTIGHSRGGKGVLWQASDKHRHEWPAGVRVRSVVALAPVYFVPPGEHKGNTLVTKIPFEVITASCDTAVGGSSPGREYLRDVKGRNPDARWVDITGGDHDNFNTRWTRGNIGGYDDSSKPCPGKIGGRTQRDRTEELVTAFFRHTLKHPEASRPGP
jgi:hypothetical protein